MIGRRGVNTVPGRHKTPALTELHACEGPAPGRSAAVNTLLQEDEVFDSNPTGQTPTPKCLQTSVEAHDWNRAYKNFGEFKVEFGVRKNRTHVLAHRVKPTKNTAKRRFGIKDSVAFHSHHAAYGLQSLLEVYEFLLLEKTVLVWYVCDVMGVREWREAKVVTLLRCKEAKLGKDEYIQMSFDGQDYIFQIEFLHVNEMFRHTGAYVEKNFIKVQQQIVCINAPCACVEFRTLTWGKMQENHNEDKTIKWIPTERVSKKLFKNYRRL